MSQNFNTSGLERLQYFLKINNFSHEIEKLTPDASTREFFRIQMSDTSAIACVYPEKFDSNLPQINVTNLFLKCNLPVAEILEVDFDRGIVLQQDFGDKILREYLENTDDETKEILLNKAIGLIAEIQNSTTDAFEYGSIASKLKFDQEKLLWELNFFKTHYFESFTEQPLSKSQNRKLENEFTELSRELENYATVLTHRDYHAANLMLDENNNLKIIDHQDARIGSVTYDLVSLLLDRVTEIPKEFWLLEKKQLLLSERENLGLVKIEFEKFEYEFKLMTIQRCLKAIGTFSNQAANFNKNQYIQYIEPMFKIVLDSCESLQRFPNLQRIISNKILS